MYCFIENPDTNRGSYRRYTEEVEGVIGCSLNGYTRSEDITDGLTGMYRYHSQPGMDLTVCSLRDVTCIIWSIKNG